MKYEFTSIACAYWDWAGVVAQRAEQGWEHVQSLRRSTNDDIDILFRRVKA